MGVDDGRNRIGRIVKTVHELEAQRDQQRETQKGEDTHRHRLAHIGGVGGDAIAGIGQPTDQQGGEDPAPRRVETRVEPRSTNAGFGLPTGKRIWCHDGISLRL